MIHEIPRRPSWKEKIISSANCWSYEKTPVTRRKSHPSSCILAAKRHTLQRSASWITLQCIFNCMQRPLTVQTVHGKVICITIEPKLTINFPVTSIYQLDLISPQRQIEISQVAIMASTWLTNIVAHWNVKLPTNSCRPHNCGPGAADHRDMHPLVLRGWQNGICSRKTAFKHNRFSTRHLAPRKNVLSSSSYVCMLPEIHLADCNDWSSHCNPRVGMSDGGDGQHNIVA